MIGHVAWNKGKHLTAKHKENISLSRQGSVVTVEARKKISAALTGRVFSDEHLRKLSIATRKHQKVCDGSCGNYVCMITNGELTFQLTSIQKRLGEYLLEQGIVCAVEVPFGRYRVDLYDGLTHTAYEADGNYWHSMPDRIIHDKHRDQYLWKKFRLEVIRFSEADIRELVL